MIWKVKRFFKVSYEKLQSLHPGQYFTPHAYESPIVIANSHTLGDSIQHKFIILQVWWSQAQHRSPLGTVKLSIRYIPSWWLQGKSWFPAQSGVGKIQFHRIVRWFWWSAQNFLGPWSLHTDPYISEPAVQRDLGPFSPCIISSPLLLLSSACKDPW